MSFSPYMLKKQRGSLWILPFMYTFIKPKEFDHVMVCYYSTWDPFSSTLLAMVILINFIFFFPSELKQINSFNISPRKALLWSCPFLFPFLSPFFSFLLPFFLSFSLSFPFLIFLQYKTNVSQTCKHNHHGNYTAPKVNFTVLWTFC